MTTARLTGPNPDRSQETAGFERWTGARDRDGTHARPASSPAGPHVPPPPVRGRASMVARCGSRLSLLIAALSPQRTGHGPTYGTPPGQRRARPPDTPVGPRTRPDTPGTYLIYAALAEPASLVLWSGETKDQLFLFLDRAGRARRTPVRGR